MSIRKTSLNELPKDAMPAATMERLLGLKRWTIGRWMDDFGAHGFDTSKPGAKKRKLYVSAAIFGKWLQENHTKLAIKSDKTYGRMVEILETLKVEPNGHDVSQNGIHAEPETSTGSGPCLSGDVRHKVQSYADHKKIEFDKAMVELLEDGLALHRVSQSFLSEL